MRRSTAVLAAAALVAVGCSGPILANPAETYPAVVASSPAPPSAPDPQPVVLPRDDGPHDRLTEWWYYTGHLVASDGRRFGFEAVTFRAERGRAPLSWASHLALTDETGQRFLYGQRAQIGPGVDQSPVDGDGVPTGFALATAGFDSANPVAPPSDPWVLAGSNGRDIIRAGLSPAEATRAGGAFGLDLLLSATRPATLHGGVGWIDLAPAGSSYYYSRTRMDVAGQLELDGKTLSVSGLAWFDHQWGDFIAVGGGGWDWFAINLADGTDLMISLVRAGDGTYPLIFGTLVGQSGTSRQLEAPELTVTTHPGATWTSPTTGATYPAGWTILVPSAALQVQLQPTVAAQELDARATTGVTYWEGSQVVSATHDGVMVGGEAYVELTGYGPAGP